MAKAAAKKSAAKAPAKAPAKAAAKVKTETITLRQLAASLSETHELSKK